MYLGTTLKCMQLHCGILACSMSPTKYIQKTGRICEEYVPKHFSKGYKLLRRAENQFESGFIPNWMCAWYWDSISILLSVLNRSSEMDY